MLHADALAFAHPGQAAPYMFSFEAMPGEITAVSGTSGSGKSTLLDLIAGFLQPLSGSLTLDGTSLLPLPPEERPVSLLLQADSLFEHLRTDSNVRLGLPARTARADARTRIAQHKAVLTTIRQDIVKDGVIRNGPALDLNARNETIRKFDIVDVDPIVVLDPDGPVHHHAVNGIAR